MSRNRAAFKNKSFITPNLRMSGLNDFAIPRRPEFDPFSNDVRFDPPAPHSHRRNAPRGRQIAGNRIRQTHLGRPETFRLPPEKHWEL
jgi:hypothetical protein